MDKFNVGISNFTKDEIESDDRYNTYKLTVPIKIFEDVLIDEDLDEFYLNINRKVSLADIIDKINEYLNWFQNCEQELKQYYEMQLKEDVDDSWFNELEVYSADITFNSLEDYGATISCGDNILVDHILEFDFEKDQIVDIRMNG